MALPPPQSTTHLKIIFMKTVLAAGIESPTRKVNFRLSSRGNNSAKHCVYSPHPRAIKPSSLKLFIEPPLQIEQKKGGGEVYRAKLEPFPSRGRE